MTLDPTWKRVMRVWWAFLWRNVLISIPTVLVGAGIGAIVGSALAAVGATDAVVRMVTLPIGLALGCVASMIPIGLILGKDFGEFRLVLLAKERDESQLSA